MPKVLASKWTKVVLFLLSLVPLAYLVQRVFERRLTGNPIEYITHFTGDWTIRFLMITLTVTPLRKLFNEPQLVRFRRMLGLFAFTYGMMHFSVWLVLDKFFAWREMVEDVFKRRFIFMG